MMPLFVNRITPSVMHSVTGTASHMPCGEMNIGIRINAVCNRKERCKHHGQQRRIENAVKQRINLRRTEVYTISVFVFYLFCHVLGSVKAYSSWLGNRFSPNPPSSAPTPWRDGCRARRAPSPACPSGRRAASFSPFHREIRLP